MIHRKSIGLNAPGFNRMMLLGKPEKKNTRSKGDRGGPAKNPPMLKLVSFKF